MNKTILVVDDDDQVIKVISKILENDNIDITSVKSVKEALEILKFLPIDLLIVDYYLTNGKGFDVVKVVKEENSTIPVIMVSGAGKTLKIYSLEAGVNIYLEKPFNGRELRQITLNLLSLAETQRDLENANAMISALSQAVEIRDEYTQGHSHRVQQYSILMYDTIGFDNEEEREALKEGCLLHDIGKIGIPDYILKSKNKLNDEEYNLIKQHPMKGYEICKDLKRLQKALPIIKHHHEKLDGSGYPDGLTENEIPEIVQIVTIADIFDALTSQRSYRTKILTDEAFDLMKKEVKQNKLNKYFFDILYSMKHNLL